MEKVKLLLHQNKHSYSDFEYYHLHIEKIESNKSKHPDIAIESCKSLIEGVSKSVLNRLDATFDEKKATKGNRALSVQKLFGKALAKIAEYSEDFEASFIHSAGQIVNVISATRTERGDISHGKSVPKLVESSPEFAEMVTNMTDLIVSYTLKYFFQIDTTDKEKLDYFPKDEENPTEDEETIIKYNSYLDESQPNFPISTTSYSQLLYENDYDEYEIRFSDEFLKTLEPDEDSDETEKEEPKETVKVSNSTIEHLVKEFFADVLWTDKRNAELTVFAEKENLKEAELKQVINSYLDEEKAPLPDNVIATLKSKPSLKNRRNIAKKTTIKIIELAKSLNNDNK